MAILNMKQIRKMNEKELNKKLEELRLELSKEKGNINVGASVTSPGKIKEIRKTIARILTYKNELKRERK